MPMRAQDFFDQQHRDLVVAVDHKPYLDLDSLFGHTDLVGIVVVDHMPHLVRGFGDHLRLDTCS